MKFLKYFYVKLVFDISERLTDKRSQVGTSRFVYPSAIRAHLKTSLHLVELGESTWPAKRVSVEYSLLMSCLL